MALRMLYHHADAEDATQDVFVKVLKGLPSFRGDSRFRTWLYRIAVNHMLNIKKDRWSDFYGTVLKGAWLNGANLQGVQLTMTDLTGAHLTDCKVYGLSAWDLTLDRTTQGDFVIRYRASATRSPHGPKGGEEEVRVGSLDLAAFMYLTLNNGNISRIIDEAGRRWVLLLGRFSRRKQVLLKLKAALKDRGFVPVIFDFPQPHERDLLETIMLLGGLSAFVIAETSDPRSAPMEVLAIATNYGVPIFPIAERRTSKGTGEVSMFAGLRMFRWVFPTIEYNDTDMLLERLDSAIVRPATAMRRDLVDRKAIPRRAAGSTRTRR